MTKKAIIMISLVSEAETTDNKEIEKQIERQIKEESFSIPFCAEIEKVEIEESESAWVKKLRKRGLSKTVASNIAMLYNG